MRRTVFLLAVMFLCAMPFAAQAASPVITQHPASQSTTVGQPVVFVSNASGTSPLQYQWFRNLVQIQNATNRNYGIPGVVLADDGTQFFVIVTNASGSATSTVATLTVGPDNVSPTLVKVGNTPNFMQVNLKFSERVSGSTANNPSNYALNGGVVSLRLCWGLTGQT